MIRTKACDLLGIEHPVVLAGMGNTSAPELVAAVSNAGGLGILACTWRTAEANLEMIREIRRRTSRPFGVNFVLHLADPDTLDACFAERVPVYSFFRGHPADAITRAHAAGAVTIHQVTTIAEAVEARNAGVDVIVAQGREAGGHIGPVPLWTLLPAVIDAVGDVPVLAAGGLVDGRDLAAALVMGAAGVLMGTRFLASHEAAAWPAHKQAILDSVPGDTIASGIWDLLWGETWPGIKVRALRNATTDRWAGRESELALVADSLRAEFESAYGRQDADGVPLLAGVGSARITELLPAGQIVRDVVADAQRALGRAAALAEVED